jgi:hypothetical protein
VIAERDLAPAQWSVLALLAEEPGHGWALAKQMAATGEVGRVWSTGRPLVYRVLDVLEERGLIEPTVINEGELQGFDLAAYDCVFLCNVRMFTEHEAQALETYLTGGGGVVWCLGDQVSLENYNQVLYRQGTGSLPARLTGRRGDAAQRDNVYNFDPGDFSHPIVGAFQGNPDAGLESTQAFVYVKAELSKGVARTALAFDTAGA